MATALPSLPQVALESELVVVTQNAWGGVAGWSVRRDALANYLARVKPHVVGLQEVHTEGTRSQAHEVAAMVGGYDAIFAPGRVGNGGGNSEGVALLCRCDVREHAVEALTLDRTDRWDGESQRVVLHATVDLPAGSVDVFVTHLSLSERARVRTICEIQAFVARQRERSGSLGAVLLGDLNAIPADSAIAALELPPTGPPWVDAWKVHEGPRARGGTWPSFLPWRRIDYVFIQPGGAWEVLSCERLPFIGSDHLGVLARLRVHDGSVI